MEGDGIEEGLESATSPLLLGDKSTGNTATSNQHSITPILVFSTFVALCGSFSYGCSVSIYIHARSSGKVWIYLVSFMIGISRNSNSFFSCHIPVLILFTYLVKFQRKIQVPIITMHELM
jgi:hypothetical protein